MAINFPSNPLLNDEFTSGSNTWIWNGVTWNIKPLGSSLNDLSDVDTAIAEAGQLLGYNGSTWSPISLSGTFNGGTISGTLKVNNLTASSSSTTGALQVTGGVGIVGELHTASLAAFGGDISSSGTVTSAGLTSSADVSIRSRNTLKLYDSDNTNYVGIRPPSVVSSDLIFVLPSSYGTSGQFLQSNGTGGLAWATPAGGSGGGGVSNPPGGSIGDIQYNSGDGTFSGSATLTYDADADTLNLTSLSASESISAANIEVSSSITTLDLTVTGTILGNLTSSTVQISGGTISGDTEASLTSLSASGNVSFTKDTNSTSSTTGAMVIAGGVGIGQDVFVNGKISVNTTIAASGNISTNTNISAGGNITATGNVTVGQHVVINNVPTISAHATNKQYVDTRAVAMSIAMS